MQKSEADFLAVRLLGACDAVAHGGHRLLQTGSGMGLRVPSSFRHTTLWSECLSWKWCSREHIREALALPVPVRSGRRAGGSDGSETIGALSLSLIKA